MSPDTPAMTDAELADAQTLRDWLLTMAGEDHRDNSGFYGQECRCGDVWPCPVDARLRTAANFMTAMLAEVKRTRAQQQEPLSDEYGIRVTYVSTRTAEGPIADTLGEALAALDAFDAQGRSDVVSRELRVRKVGKWRKVGGHDV